MGEPTIVLQNPDPNTVALIISWLNQGPENDQDAEGDYLSIYTFDNSHPVSRILLGGAATGLSPQPVFWRTRQVQQYLSSREVNDRYKSIREELGRTAEKVAEAPEFLMEPSSVKNNEENDQWYLDSGSNSVQDASQTDSEVYKSSHGSVGSSDSGTIENKVDDPNPEISPPEKEKEIGLPLDQQPAPPDLLDNPLLRAFLLDLDDVEMTPMLHLVANMMTPMYFTDEEAAVVHHYLLHKVESTINNIQERIDQLNSVTGSGTETADASSNTLTFEEAEGETEESSTATDVEDEEVVEEDTFYVNDRLVLQASANVAPVAKICQLAEEEEPLMEEVLVEKVEDNEGVTEESMKVVAQMMLLKSNRKRKKLAKRTRLSKKELAVVKYFEESMRTKSSFWSCCGGGGGAGEREEQRQ